MTTQIDQLPYYDPLLRDSDTKMNEIWVSALSSFIDTLNGYLSDFGMFVPRLTTAQRDSIQSPVDGQLIYNTTLNKFQGRENGVWTNLI